MGLHETIMGIVDTGRISMPTVLDATIGRLTVERCDERLDWWSRKLLRDADVSLEVRGREHAEGSRPLIVMSNHQSLYDIPVLFQSLPGRLRMVAKTELFRVPVWGQAMHAAGFIRIDRRDRHQAVESLRSSASLLKEGTRIWIAPEGTRSWDGLLGEFKSGGFRLALETNTPILPVAIDGTRKVLPAKGFLVQKHQQVVVTVLPPIDPARYGLERRKDLMRDVRAAIAGALGQDPSIIAKGVAATEAA